MEKTLTVRLSKTMYDNLYSYAEKYGLPVSYVVRQSITKLVQKPEPEADVIQRNTQEDLKFKQRVDTWE
jgi:predicted DNA-binding protein